MAWWDWLVALSLGTWNRGHRVLLCPTHTWSLAAVEAWVQKVPSLRVPGGCETEGQRLPWVVGVPSTLPSGCQDPQIHVISWPVCWVLRQDLDYILLAALELSM